MLVDINDRFGLRGGIRRGAAVGGKAQRRDARGGQEFAAGPGWFCEGVRVVSCGLDLPLRFQRPNSCARQSSTRKSAGPRTCA
jgi:hypothetical protein